MEENIQWVETKSNTRTFQLGEEPELIHIIQTGFKDKFMVVSEDAYELSLGNVSFYTREELETKCNIQWKK